VDAAREIVMLGVEIKPDVPRGRLEVEVADHFGKRTVTICRAADEGPLQVQNLREGVPPSETPLVFGRPVPAVHIERSEDGQWRLDLDDVEVVDAKGLSQFLRIVAQFGVRATKS
jgi:hypothetical protein